MIITTALNVAQRFINQDEFHSLLSKLHVIRALEADSKGEQPCINSRRLNDDTEAVQGDTRSVASFSNEYTQTGMLLIDKCTRQNNC